MEGMCINSPGHDCSLQDLCAAAYQPVAKPSCGSQHWAQRLQQPGQDKQRLSSHHLLTKVGCEGRIEATGFLESLCNLYTSNQLHLQQCALSGLWSEPRAKSYTSNLFTWSVLQQCEQPMKCAGIDDGHPETLSWVRTISPTWAQMKSQAGTLARNPLFLAC